jgi:hypothetical protein
MAYKLKTNLLSLVAIFTFSYIFRLVFQVLSFRTPYFDFVWASWFDVMFYFTLGLIPTLILKSLKIRDFLILALVFVLIDYGRIGILLRPLTGQGYLNFGDPRYVSAYISIAILAISPLFIILGAYVGLLVQRKLRSV